MSFLRKNSKKVKEVKEIDLNKTREQTTTKTDNIGIASEKTKNTPKKKNTVIVSGRLFGASDLTAPLGSVKNYETKILDKTEISILTDKGWISKEAIKD